MKKSFKIILLCGAAALCACGVAACANKPKNPTVTVDQLIAANDRQNVIDKYGNLHVTETTEYESGSSFTANSLFYANDYGLAMDYLDEKSDGSEYNSSTIMNGMMYVRIKNSTSDIFYATVFADDAYSGYVGSIYNLAANETVKAPEVKDGKIVVESTFEYTLLNYSEKKTYYFNTQTLLIERLTSQTEMATSYSSAKSTAEATYEYGCSDYTPAMTAYNAHINAENKSSFLVVRNAGTAGEKRTEYTIADESDLSVHDGDEKEYALFENPSCTNPIDDIVSFIASNENPIIYLGENKHYDQAYKTAVEDAMIAEESEIKELVTLTENDEMVSWKDGKVLLLTFHKYPSSYVEESTFTTGDWYMWTVTDKEMIAWFAKYSDTVVDWSVAFNQLLGMPLSSANTHVSAVWVDVNSVIRPAYQPDPTKQLTASDLNGSSLGEYEEWFDANILNSYFSSWGQYPWTRLGYTYNWGGDSAYGLTEFLVLKNSTITVEFTMTLNDFYLWLYNQTTADELAQAA